ncbi:putative DUF5610 domain-containing protein [Gammaproteobacteria bacterium]
MVQPVSYPIDASLNYGVNRSRFSTPTPSRAAVSGQPTDASSTPASIGTEASSSGPAATRKVLNQQILRSLNQALGGADTSKIDTLNPGDFSPKKTAERLLTFISSAIGLAKSNGADDEKLKGMYQSARDAVDKGFKDAKDVLKGLGAWDGQVKTDAEKTVDLVQNGINRLEKGQSPFATDAATESQAMLVAASQSQGYQFSLDVQTAEGDKIQVHFNQQQSSSVAAIAAQSGNASIAGMTSQSSSQSHFDLTIEGNLNDQERQALKDLMGKIDGVANQFFGKGNLQDVLKKAGDLGYDGQQLAGFTLSMGYSETRSLTSAYQAVSNMKREGADTGAAGQAGANAGALPDNGLRDLGQLMRQMKDVMGVSALDGLFADPAKLTGDLLRGRLLGDSRAQPRAQQENQGGDQGAVAKTDASKPPEEPDKATAAYSLQSLSSGVPALAESVDRLIRGVQSLMGIPAAEKPAPTEEKPAPATGTA